MEKITIILFAIAAVFLLITVYLFIRFNIPTVIGELSGRTAKKSIAKMRDNNVSTGDKSHRPSKAAKERGTLTDKIDDTPATTPIPMQAPPADASNEVLFNNKMSADSNATTVLSNNQQPFMNDSNATVPLNIAGDYDDNATTPLDNVTELLDEGTTVLNPQQAPVAQAPVVPAEGFEIIQNIVLVHTNETI